MAELSCCTFLLMHVVTSYSPPVHHVGAGKDEAEFGARRIQQLLIEVGPEVPPQIAALAFLDRQAAQQQPLHWNQQPHIQKTCIKHHYGFANALLVVTWVCDPKEAFDSALAKENAAEP